MREISKIAAVKQLPSKSKVAAYCRVSSGKEHMLHSLTAQVSHYSQHIQNRRDWEYAGVYADEAKTGTKDDRPEFMRLLADCKVGKIDLIITKSISRFARNTVTTLETVRELNSMGIGVFFEEQNINTLSGDGELMLTILASYAQEESRSVSENIKWRIRNNMKSGKTIPHRVYGFNVTSGKLVIKPDEADVVRKIFNLYLSGLGFREIAKKLNAQGVKSPKGGSKWYLSVVRKLLTNEKMCGDIKFQKHFVENHLTKHVVRNRGELPMFYLSGTHEGIVSKETWDSVQAEILRRSKKGEIN